jgi:hypothetical protein
VHTTKLGGFTRQANLMARSPKTTSHCVISYPRWCNVGNNVLQQALVLIGSPLLSSIFPTVCAPSPSGYAIGDGPYPGFA